MSWGNIREDFDLRSQTRWWTFNRIGGTKSPGCGHSLSKARWEAIKRFCPGLLKRCEQQWCTFWPHHLDCFGCNLLESQNNGETLGTNSTIVDNGTAGPYQSRSIIFWKSPKILQEQSASSMYHRSCRCSSFRVRGAGGNHVHLDAGRKNEPYCCRSRSSSSALKLVFNPWCCVLGWFVPISRLFIDTCFLFPSFA